MKYTLEDKYLEVVVEQNLNLLTARHIEALAVEAEQVTIDLAHARIVDSEGIMLFARLLQNGKELRLKYPPQILYDVVKVLHLSHALPLDELVVEKRRIPS